MNTYKKKIKWNIVKALNTLDKNKKKNDNSKTECQKIRKLNFKFRTNISQTRHPYPTSV